jgi:fused signal recognition particle receptor
MALFDRFKGKKKDDKDAVENQVNQAEVVLEEPVASNHTNQSEDAVDSGDGAEVKRRGLFEKFKSGLTKTRKNFSEKIDTLIKSNGRLDDEYYDELEEILIQADVGVNTALELVENIKKTARKEKLNDSSEVTGLLQAEIARILHKPDTPVQLAPEKPTVIMVVGVNGAGKTTSIAKMAYRFKNEQHKVLLAAADTFRAAAIDQLQIWADRVGVELIKHQEGSDPGAVVYDAVHAAQARKADILIIDTAGRLQNKANLMKEISKVRKVIEREIPDAPHEVLLVLDATTGQNAISQARLFAEATGVTGIILTKLDGTARGGIVLAIARELDMPVKLVGVGEGMEDLREFSAELFAQALFS